MRLYRILLADDEREICEGIARRIDWAQLGYTFVGSAENGVDALEKAERLHPDVIMTDIKMPFLSGLDLCERICAMMPSTKMIVFSGFDDFKFAQQAIKLHVAEYILKPIDSVELTKTLKKMKAQLDREFNEKTNVEMLRKAYEDSLPIMRQQFFSGLIEGHLTPEQLSAQAHTFHLNLDVEGWAAALLRADPNIDEKCNLKGKEELIPISVKSILDDMLGNFCSFIDFLYYDCVIVIAYFHDNNLIPMINGINEVCKSAQRVLNLKVMAGIGTIKPDLHQLRESYREAFTALEYSAGMGGDKAIYINDVEPDETARIEFFQEDEEAISNLIKMGDERKIKEKIDSFFSHPKSALLPFDQYRIYLLEIITSFLKVLHAYGLDGSEIFDENFSYTDALTKLQTPDEIKQWCAQVCIRISSKIKRQRVNNTKILAQHAIEYIEENYQKTSISVEDLCSFLHVSPTYFSTVFKRETGKSFVSYLTEVRLRQAVDLLNTTEDKTYVIAQKVGYAEPNYFSYVFKKKFGVSPSRYRDS
ncbi:response regulator [Caproicibacter fermentans]|uniref:Stage 0 sporulation protein A homolog n=1 Tax=Caproicibacter fermentans TaxID=2576756 RepID=A0A7G8TBM9_9FIRM|nr:response regulator [Caproicibacter fermentans]QNK41020.1 response regulator [Caproicibacter fermentans]